MRCAEPAFGHRNRLTLLTQLEHILPIERANRSFVTTARRRLQKEFGPLCALDRPLVLKAPLRVAMPAFADQQFDRRLAHDAGIDSFEPMIEEPQLIFAALSGIERVVV